MEKQQILSALKMGKTYLGIEMGSTRIKAVLIGPDHSVLATGAHNWENKLENGYWTYDLQDVWAGVQDAYVGMAAHVRERYGDPLNTLGAMCFSSMMHR